MGANQGANFPGTHQKMEVALELVIKIKQNKTKEDKTKKNDGSQ